MKSNSEAGQPRDQAGEKVSNITGCYIFWLHKILQFAIFELVQLLGRNIIDAFRRKHPTSRKALARWVKLIEGAEFRTPQDIKLMFGGSVDFVGGQTFFDVGGNKIRAIAKIAFEVKVVLVTHVLSHKEYDKIKWKE